jgi:hypothetical protein
MMSKKVFGFMVTCCLLTLVAATAHAQMPGTALRASIPFDFSVRGRVLPAGVYEISRIADGPDGLIIRSVGDQHEHEVFETNPVQERRVSKRSELIFHRYGESYFLSEVLAGGQQSGAELPHSRQEKTLAREMASSGQKGEPQTVSLAAY